MSTPRPAFTPDAGCEGSWILAWSSRTMRTSEDGSVEDQWRMFEPEEEAEARKAYAKLLAHPLLYCAVLSRAITSTEHY